MNPLLSPFDTAPFSKLKNEHFMPAFTKAIAEARAEIDAITTNTAKPTFKNTIAALDYAGQQLDRVSSVFFNLNSAETNAEIQKIAQEISPLLSEFGNDITLNEALFEKVKAVYDEKENLKLTTEEQTLLDKKYKSFSRNGANLSEDKKKRLREIDAELSKLKLLFGENVLAETNKFEMHLTNEADLDGLPEGEKEAAAQMANAKDKKGWLITLDYPSYIPFMKYAKNRTLRKELSIAFGSKGFHNDELDNQQNVLHIAKLRFERANLLGYKTHAHFVLEERMAETPEKVHEFLNELLEKAKPAAEREFKELEDFAKELDNIDRLEKWDGSYYSEKLKQKLFDLDDEKLKPYFKLENVIAGVFKVAEKLYGLQFEEVFDIDKYHADVKTYRIYDENRNLVSLFYADFHPRSGKRGGAWMTSFKSNTVYPGLSGTSVYWDFVELPSQILENWCYEKEALELFATHYENGAIIPMELVQKIKDSATFQEGMQTLRQLSFGLLDMAWHGSDPTQITDVKAQENKAFIGTELYPESPETCMSTSFSHIFQGGYSSGYYSYKWAEVLDADAFAYFKEKGIFDKEVATKFKDNILSKGGTENPMELYKKFRGAAPKIEPLLERAGLL